MPNDATNDNKNTLKYAIVLNEYRALLCGILVVFGLIIELLVAAAYRDHPSFFENWGPVIADVFVTSGVFGEIFFARKARAASEILQIETDAKVADTYTLAMIADSRSAAANSAAADAQQKLAKAIDRAAEAEIKAAEAVRMAESERHARTELESALASRRLSSEQQGALIAALIAVKDRIPVIVVTRLRDPEAFNFSVDIIQAIGRAGIHVDLTEKGLMSSPPYGLCIADVPGDTLKFAFASAGIKKIIWAINKADPPMIIVGLKPLAF